MAIANICDLDSAGTQDTENASLVTGKKKPAGRAQPRRRQLKKPDSAETSLARACRKPAGGLRKRTPPVSSLQRQPPRKLTSMLKVVKSGAVADSKRSKRIGASPQSPLAKLDIPTSPLIASPSPSL
ncbi:hypothetical protein LPJ57_001947 [Coemansia sp. RSA 486]|nr:hypothetical protein LPJ57_001947 [Coemansia sp. RSA 486]